MDKVGPDGTSANSCKNPCFDPHGEGGGSVLESTVLDTVTSVNKVVNVTYNPDI